MALLRLTLKHWRRERPLLADAGSQPAGTRCITRRPATNPGYNTVHNLASQQAVGKSRSFWCHSSCYFWIEHRGVAIFSLPPLSKSPSLANLHHRPIVDKQGQTPMQPTELLFAKLCCCARYRVTNLSQQCTAVREAGHMVTFFSCWRKCFSKLDKNQL